MKVFTKGYFRRLFLIFTLCLLIAGCSSEKEYKFTFNRKDGETYIQKLSVSRERHMGSTDIQTDDTLSETRVTCRKTKDGWDIIAQPLNRIIMRNGKEVKNPLLALLSKFKITYKIDKDGELKDVAGYEKMEETIKSKYPAKVVQGLSAALDIDALKQKEFSEWNGRIGNFINKEFSIGDVWEDDVPYRLPNGAKLNYKVKTNFKKQVEYNGVKCVLIEQTYDSTGGGITDSVKDIAESVSTKEGRIAQCR